MQCSSYTPISLTLSDLSPLLVLSSRPFSVFIISSLRPLFHRPLPNSFPSLPLVYFLFFHDTLPSPFCSNRFFLVPAFCIYVFRFPFSPLLPLPTPPLLAWCSLPSLPSLRVSFPSRYLLTAPLSCSCRREGLLTMTSLLLSGWRSMVGNYYKVLRNFASMGRRNEKELVLWSEERPRNMVSGPEHRLMRTIRHHYSASLKL